MHNNNIFIFSDEENLLSHAQAESRSRAIEALYPRWTKIKFPRDDEEEAAAKVPILDRRQRPNISLRKACLL